MATSGISSSGPGSQDEEIASLKKRFTTCKVISNVGDFQHVVEVGDDNLDLTLKFQLESSYPSVTPHSIVKSQQLLSLEDKSALTGHLQAKALELSGKFMIEKLYNTAVEWIFESGLHQVIPSKIEPKVNNNKKMKKTKKCKSNTDGSERQGKKLSMKTATDVVSRIIWDDKISVEDFSVGYLDRFVGIVERAFSTFTWEDLASVDYEALAIPKHRIHYFKYKDLKVWDKDQRMDYVFGSTGSGLTITDVMDKYEAAVSQRLEKSSDQKYNDSEDEDVVIKTGVDEKTILQDLKACQEATRTKNGITAFFTKCSPLSNHYKANQTIVNTVQLQRAILFSSKITRFRGPDNSRQNNE